MNKRGPRIDSQETPCLNIPQSDREKKLSTNIRIMNENTGVNLTFCKITVCNKFNVINNKFFYPVDFNEIICVYDPTKSPQIKNFAFGIH
jgi:hypothetical protein